MSIQPGQQGKDVVGPDGCLRLAVDFPGRQKLVTPPSQEKRTNIQAGEMLAGRERLATISLEIFANSIEVDHL